MMGSMGADSNPKIGIRLIPRVGVGIIQTRRMRPRDVLAKNLKALMAANPALSTFPQITKAGGPSNGTLDRIRRKTHATNIDTLEQLGDVFGLEPWQLLMPNLEVDQRLTAARRALVSLSDLERLELFASIAQPGLPDSGVEQRMPVTKTPPAFAKAPERKKPATKKAA